MHELWWDHLCPAMANIGPLKDAQRELMALGVSQGDSGRILSKLHRDYVDAVFKAAERYENGEEE